jgi:anti-anti-sigma factor
VAVFHVRHPPARLVRPVFPVESAYGTGSQLTVATRPEHDGAVLVVSGELDVAVAAGLGACFDAALSHGLIRMVLDLHGLDFCDCAGLGAFVRGHRLTLARDGWVRLARVQPRVARIVRIGGLGAVFGGYDSTDAAFRETKGSPHRP